MSSREIDWPRLIAAAKAVCGEFPLSEGFTAGSVGAAMLTAKGNVYTGVCVELACGLGLCAEIAAMAEMLKFRETHVLAAVAVSRHGVISPCGRCREMLAQVDVRNLDCRIILGQQQVVALGDLLPNHWLADKQDHKRRASQVKDAGPHEDQS